MLYAQSTSTVISGRYTFCQKTIIAKKYVPDTDRQIKRQTEKKSQTERVRDRERQRQTETEAETENNKTKQINRDTERHRKKKKEKKETQRGHTERKPSYILTRTENKQSEQKTSSGS